MRIINSPRGSGKTTLLIKTAYMVEMPIITKTYRSKKYILELAKEMHMKTIEVYTCDEWIRRGKHDFDRVLIDDADQILEEALSKYLSCGVGAIAMSLQMKDMEDK